MLVHPERGMYSPSLQICWLVFLLPKDVFSIDVENLDLTVQPPLPHFGMCNSRHYRYPYVIRNSDGVADLKSMDFSLLSALERKQSSILNCFPLYYLVGTQFIRLQVNFQCLVPESMFII